MNSAEDVKGEVHRFLCQRMGIDESISPGEPLFSSGLLDSIDLVEILEFIETRYAITFSAFDVGLEDMDTIASIAAQVVSRRT